MIKWGEGKKLSLGADRTVFQPAFEALYPIGFSIFDQQLRAAKCRYIALI